MKETEKKEIKEGDEILLKRGDTWIKGTVELVDDMTFFVGKDGFTYALNDNDVIKIDGSVDVKVTNIPRRFKRRAGELGVPLTNYIMYCMAREIEGSVTSN